MHLQIKKINNELVKLSEQYFSNSFFTNKHSGIAQESIIARYIICNYIEKNEKIILSQEDKKNIYDYTHGYKGLYLGTKKYYFSISHKNGLVFAGIDDKKIGVDIEKFLERDKSLLKQFNDDEYRILGGKNWKNFYILWTSKESIIKYSQSGLDDMTQIVLINNESLQTQVCDVRFSFKLCFLYKGTQYRVTFGTDEESYYSVCH